MQGNSLICFDIMEYNLKISHKDIPRKILVPFLNQSTSLKGLFALIIMENSNLIEKFFFSLLVSPIFIIGVIMIIKTNVSSIWIRCLMTVNVGCKFRDKDFNSQHAGQVG